MKHTGFGAINKEPQKKYNPQNWRRWSLAVAAFALVGLSLTVFAWRSEAAPATEALPEPAATPKTPPPAEGAAGFFSLTANRTYSTTNSPRVWLDYRNLGDIDFRAPKPRMVETIGFEPTTPCLQSRCSPS